MKNRKINKRNKVMKLLCVVVIMIFFGCEKGVYNGSEGNVSEEYLDTINGYKYVDLGLPSGLKWAECNIGATTPEQYGDFYAWGELYTKSTYYQSNCETYGKKDIGDISGDTLYDAATANWGASWRMPTKIEMEELKRECNREWITINGVNGYKLTGPNGKSIFLPATGFRRESLHLNVNEYGAYWASTPYQGEGNNSGYTYFLVDRYSVAWNSRFMGFAIRPVSD